MSETSTPLAPRLRNSEGNLYETCLDACIEGIKRLQLDTRHGSHGEYKSLSPGRLTRLPVANRASLLATLESNDQNLAKANHKNSPNPTYQFAAFSPIQQAPALSLLSQHPSPSSFIFLPATGSPLHLALPTVVMNHSLLHEAPSRGAPVSGWGSQDARSNLAIQPAANVGSIKLKKNAVRIVGAAGPTSRLLPRASTPVPPMASSPALGPVKANSKETPGYVFNHSSEYVCKSKQC